MFDSVGWAPPTIRDEFDVRQKATAVGITLRFSNAAVGFASQDQ
jgi:hypothetical protein